MSTPGVPANGAPIRASLGAAPPISSATSTVSASTEHQRLMPRGTPAAVMSAPVATAVPLSGHSTLNGTAGVNATPVQQGGGVTIVFDNIAVATNRGTKTMIEDATGILKSGQLTAIVSCCGARGDYFLLSALAGHDECTAGNLCANGTPVVSPDYRRNAVLIDECMAAQEQLTVRQNLEFSSQMRCVQDAQLHTRTVARVMEAMKLETWSEREVGRCGLYVRRRVAVAKELVLNPCAAFIDSPVDGLLTHEAKEFLMLLRQYAVNADAVVGVCMVQPRWTILSGVDHVILVERSRVAFVGSSAELMQNACGDALEAPSPAHHHLEASPEALGGGYGAAKSRPIQLPEPVVVVPRLASRSLETTTASVSAGTPTMDPPTLSDEDDGGDYDDSEQQGQRLKVHRTGQASASSRARRYIFPEAILNDIYRTASGPSATLSTHYPKFAMIRLRTAEEVRKFLQRCANGELQLLPPGGRGGFFTTPSGSFGGPTLSANPSTGSLSHPPMGGMVAGSKNYYYYTAAGPLKKLWVLSKFGILQVKNSFYWYLAMSVLGLLIAILLAKVYTNQNNQIGMQNKTGILFFLISGCLLHNMLLVDSTKKELITFQRHRDNGYYSSGTYLVYWVLTSAFTRFLGCVIFVIVIYSLARISEGVMDLTSILDLITIMGMTSFSTSTLVWFVCCIASTGRLAHFIMFGLYTYNVILGGLILNLQTMPTPFQFFSNLSLVRLGYESAIVSQFANNNFSCVSPTTPSPIATVTTALMSTSTTSSMYSTVSTTTSMTAPTNMTTTVAPPPSAVSCFTGDKYLQFLSFSEARKWANLEYMTEITLVIVIASFFAMVLIKSPNAKK